jgi:hypothetical protein
MSAIKGTWQHGQIVLSEAVNWPDGTKVIIEPVGQQQTLGIRDEDWPTDPEGIARLVALMQSFEPIELTPEEEAEWSEARRGT